jgi:hypothetical protein
MKVKSPRQFHGQELEMSLNRSNLLPHRIFGSRLPPGVRDADCQSQSRPLPHVFTERDVWQACGPQYQERLCSDFAESNPELLRDAILDAEDGIPSVSTSRHAAARGPSLLGELIWAEWLRFRDRALRNILQSGELPEV